MSLYMVIEHFRDGQAGPVYRRFNRQGRMAPDGLTYVASWVDPSSMTCYQVMETADRGLLDEWMRHWSDLVDFEVRAVITSQEAAGRFTPRADDAHHHVGPNRDPQDSRS